MGGRAHTTHTVAPGVPITVDGWTIATTVFKKSGAVQDQRHHPKVLLWKCLHDGQAYELCTAITT